MTSNRELIRLLSDAIVEQASGNDLEAFDKVQEYLKAWTKNVKQETACRSDLREVAE